jgi:hypothetical protein
MREEVVGPTPNGGVKAIITYMDNDSNGCLKEKATKITIEEFDQNGKLVMTTWGTVT